VFTDKSIASVNATSISDQTALWMLKQSRWRLGGKPREATADDESVPEQATEPRETQIFVTPYIQGCVICPSPGTGVGNSIAEALSSALSRMSTSLVSGKERPVQNEPDRIQIDILDGTFHAIVKPAGSTTHSRQRLGAVDLIAPGLDGIVVETDGRSYYLLPSQLLYQSLFEEAALEQSAENLLARVMKHINLPADAWKATSLHLRRFRTISFVDDTQRQNVLRVERGVIATAELSRSKLIEAARMGGDYLVRMQRADGSFYYSYDPIADRVTRRSYNILRHAGTTISLFELFNATRDRQYLAAARMGVKFLKSRFRSTGDKGNRLYVLDNDRKAKLGANGLSLIALSSLFEHEPQAAERESARHLANQILAMQHRNGSFTSYHRIRGDEPDGSVSLYYPGEAILGLMRLYKLTPERRLIQAARRGADYLVDSQTRGGVLPPDAWLMQALEELYKIGRERKYAEHAIALAEAMMADQYTDSDPVGYTGGFRPGPPRATPAASRSEGMLAAYRIAILAGDARASKIAAALKASARFQVSQQFGESNSFFLSKPTRALGGFRAGITSMRIRIDFVQHNISSLLGAAQTLY
jgi:hypothetical protein